MSSSPTLERSLPNRSGPRTFALLGAAWLAVHVAASLGSLPAEVRSLVPKAESAWTKSPDERLYAATGMPREQLDALRFAASPDGTVLALWAPRADPRFDASMVSLFQDRMRYLLYPTPRRVELITTEQEASALIARDDWSKLLLVDGSLRGSMPRFDERLELLRRDGPVPTWVLERP